METGLNRNEKIIALITFIAISVFAFMFIRISHTGSELSQIDSRGSINYKMARPEESYSEYSLNGREVDQIYEGLKAKQKASAQQPDAKTKISKGTDKKLDQKKKAEAQKKAAAVSKATQLKKSESPVESRIERKSLEASQTSSSNETYNYQSDNQAQAVQTPVVDEAVTAKEKVKKTFSEWRTLIFAKPTNETIALFVEAYRKKEINETEFQAMSQDLLDQNDEKLKGLGLYALRSVPSLASLSQLVHIEAQIPATYRTYIEQAYMAYLQPQNVTYLNRALQTKDKVLVLKSLNLLGSSIQKIAKGDVGSLVDPRNRRESDLVSTYSINNFKGLVPALTELVSSQDQELAPLAQQIVSYIQSSNNVAIN
jgi:hypothetical protein